MGKFARRNNGRICLSGILILCILSLSSSGCESFRKKFIRKKAAKKEGRVPVLEPVDYGAHQFSGEERYKYYYNLWKVWEKELAQILEAERTTNKKRHIYLIDQILDQMEGMKRWLKKDKQEEFSILVDKFVRIRKEFDKPEPMRSNRTNRSSSFLVLIFPSSLQARISSSRYPKRAPDRIPIA